MRRKMWFSNYHESDSSKRSDLAAGTARPLVAASPGPDPPAQRAGRQDVTEYGAICESDFHGPAIDE